MCDNQSQFAEQVIACNFGAIDPADRNNHADTAENIFTAALDIQELEQGYAFRLPLENTMLTRISQWIANERLCCPFFTFSMIVDAELWLQLTGTDEVKDYIKSIIVNPLVATGNLPDKAAWIAAHTPTAE